MKSDQQEETAVLVILDELNGFHCIIGSVTEFLLYSSRQHIRIQPDTGRIDKRLPWWQYLYGIRDRGNILL